MFSRHFLDGPVHDQELFPMIPLTHRIQSRTQAIYWLRCDLVQRGALASLESNITLWVILRDPINYFMLLLRLNELSRNAAMVLPLQLIIRFLFRRQSLRLGFSIPPNVFERGLAIVHYGPIVVNSKVQVGRNCRIHVCTNIGAEPKLGKNIYIGPGAKLFGAITIGDNCVIGANAVVNKDFPQKGVTLAGVPAKVISNKGSEGYIIGVTDTNI
jgi:serine O-acetyltransferase